MKWIACGILFIVAMVFTAKPSYSANFQRAYFKISSEEGYTLLKPYLQHQLEEKVFSIQAPDFVINRLKNSDKVEFRGYATMWKIAARRSTGPTCNPTTPIPWGVTQVRGGAGGDGVKVAVLDTGITTTHPDLKNNIIDCKDTQSSWIKNYCTDGNGHGTHVSGTIAANGKIKGVAPNAKLLAIKVCSNSGYCWSDDVARGIRYAADAGANIINLSLGGSSLSQDEKLALDYAWDRGVLIIAASGNDGPADNSINYPAAYQKVVSVGALDKNISIASFSSRGNNYNSLPYLREESDIEFAAPGVAVESTYTNGCYRTYSGTSMATPHIAGLGAKLWTGDASSTRLFLQQRAQFDFVDIGRVGDDPDAGFGLPTAP